VLEGFIKELASRSLAIDELDEQRWVAAVVRMTVGVDGEMVFEF